jgi:hypothetical protein
MVHFLSPTLPQLPGKFKNADIKRVNKLLEPVFDHISEKEREWFAVVGWRRWKKGD